VIYSRQGAGNYVRAASENSVGFARIETLADVQRCYEFRIAIEVAAAEAAAVRRNGEMLATLERALDEMRNATGNRHHSEEADFGFHLGIARAANNGYFEASLNALRAHINVGMTMHGNALMTDGSRALRQVLEEHAAILAAIRDGDGAAAGRMMRAHLEHSRDRLFGGALFDLSLPEPEKR